MVYICKKLMEHIGLNPDRLRLEWVSAGEGIRFSKIMKEFVPRIEKLGPLGEGEGIDENELNLKLKAVTKLIPYIKLVLSERLSVSDRTEEAYTKFFTGEEFIRLFKELIGDKLALDPYVSTRDRDVGIEGVDNDKIDRIIKKHQDKTNSLVQALLEIQQENQWIPHEVLDRVSKKLDVPLSRVIQIVTFHKTFCLIPEGRNE